jgi:hypothetical protein
MTRSAHRLRGYRRETVGRLRADVPVTAHNGVAGYRVSELTVMAVFADYHGLESNPRGGLILRTLLILRKFRTPDRPPVFLVKVFVDN